ncbi:exonuclease domain-containing protein [Streptomyces cinereoruber]|uniref:exonuclease domain-containing protein n=1 Tax=Streptomyces cinereoruber TaxID=67260 RepID=UPI003627FB09
MATETTTPTGTETSATAPPPQPYVPEALGATRIAHLISEHTGEPVTTDDVTALVERQALTEVDRYKGWPMYSTAAARELDAGLVRSIVAERVAWQEVSLSPDAAAERIDWHWSDLERMAKESRITAGRGGRYRITDLEALAAEADDDRYVTAQSAVKDVLEVRESDWRYIESAGWISPAETFEREVGRRRTVTAPLYRLGDVRALLERPGIDWEAVRACPRGRPSPLREHVTLTPTRAAAIRAFAQRLADRHQMTVWAWNSPYSGQWELDWERGEGLPDKKEVRRELTADPEARTYASEVVLGTTWGRITRKARELLEPDRAVVLDTETTDLYGRTIEIAVIDAATGKKLMNTLVNPGDAKISDEARRVHGITDEMLADARPFEKILPRLRKVTKDRTILAYNAEFDRAVVLGDIKQAGRRPMHLEPESSWHCLMQMRTDWLDAYRWPKLGGSHRALGDCESARQALVEMSKGRGTAFEPRPPAPGAPEV